MTLDLQAKANRRTRRLVLVLVFVVVVLVTVVISLLVNRGDSSPVASSPAKPTQAAGGGPPLLSPSAVPSPTSTDPANYVAPQNWVVLAAPKQVANGLPSGWPQTPQGALAMIVAKVEHTWTSDADSDAAAARFYAIPGEGDSFASGAAAAASKLRASFGLPATGPLPSGTSLTTWPIGVAWKQLDSTSYQISILVREMATTVPGQPATVRLESTTTIAAWGGGDWKTFTTPPLPTPAPDDLGTAAFNADGWTAIQQGDH